MAEFLAIGALAATGVVVYQAMNAKVGIEKEIQKPTIRLTHSDDKSFLRDIENMHGLNAVIISENKDFSVVNVLAENRTIPTAKVYEYIARGILVLQSSKGFPINKKITSENNRPVIVVKGVVQNPKETPAIKQNIEKITQLKNRLGTFTVSNGGKNVVNLF